MNLKPIRINEHWDDPLPVYSKLWFATWRKTPRPLFTRLRSGLNANGRSKALTMEMAIYEAKIYESQTN